MGYLESAVKEISKTHPDLGELVCFSQVCVKAGMCLLVVSPAGCGKSATSNLISSSYQPHMHFDSLTRSGLQPFAKELTNFDGLIIMDDLGKVDTPYSRMATITTMTELCYSHFVSKHAHTFHIDISNFQGSALLNCQPVVLRKIVQQPEWEATIQDKTIRYYHLMRPRRPNIQKPDTPLQWGISTDKVKMGETNKPYWDKLKNIGIIQWSMARTEEHITNLLKAVAALEGQTEIRPEHYKTLYGLMKPCMLERYVMLKGSFEADRDLASNLLCILTEFRTYGIFGLEELARDYKLSQATAYRLMDQYRKYWTLTSKSPTVYAPSQQVETILGSIKPVMEKEKEKDGRNT